MACNSQSPLHQPWVGGLSVHVHPNYRVQDGPVSKLEAMKATRRSQLSDRSKTRIMEQTKRLSVRAVNPFASCYQCHDDRDTQKCLCTAVRSVQGWLREPVLVFVHVVSVLINLQACDHSAGTARRWAGSHSCVVSRHMYEDGCRSLQ